MLGAMLEGGYPPKRRGLPGPEAVHLPFPKELPADMDYQQLLPLVEEVRHLAAPLFGIEARLRAFLFVVFLKIR